MVSKSPPDEIIDGLLFGVQRGVGLLSPFQSAVRVILALQRSRNIPIKSTCRDIPSLLQCWIMPTDHQATPDRGPFTNYTPASLGDAVRYYRTEAGLTQAQLAEKAGIRRSYLSEMESGKETEQVKRLLGVLRRLGVRMTLDKADW